jgi:hypothetical protein
MALITLVGKKMAKEGEEFVYMGLSQTCKKCRLKTVCSNLKEGRTYRIVKVRDKEHKCDLHEEGVMVVEVEQLPAEVNIRKEEAEGTAVAYHPVRCDEVLCKDYDACVPGIKEKDYKIVETIGDVDCPKNYKLKKVRIDDLE